MLYFTQCFVSSIESVELHMCFSQGPIFVGLMKMHLIWVRMTPLKISARIDIIHKSSTVDFKTNLVCVLKQCCKSSRAGMNVANHV